MTIIIKKDASKKEIQEALKKVTKGNKKKLTPGNLRKHFGKLKLGIDGLEFQKKVRSEWD